MRNTIFAVLVIASAIACATAGSSGGGGATGGESAGERLYRGHCGSCHRLRDPSERTRERWQSAVERMGPRAHLSPDERELVLQYLQAHAKDAPATTPRGG